MKKIFFTLLLLLPVSFVYSQLYGGLGASNGDYKNYREAQKLWKNGDYTEAEKFYRKAYANNGNTLYLSELGNKKFEIGDIKGANSVFDIVIKDQTENLKGNQLTARQSLNLYYYQKIDNNFKKGDPEVGLASTLQFMEALGDRIGLSERNLFLPIYTSAAETAFALDNKEALIKLHEKAASIKNADYGEFLSFVYLNLLNKDYEKALKRIEDVQVNGGFMTSKTVANSLLPTVFAYMGENEKALAAIDNAKRSILLGEDDFQYVYGLIALNKKDYLGAIDRFSKAIQGKMFLYHRIEPVGKYKHYTKRAEAYLAIGDLIQARKDYDAALTYNPDYEPALNGIAKLEGRMVQDRKADKTPPVITVTEPSVSRGLKVTVSGSDIMVKGTAIDPSGLKAVSINGQAVYSQEAGSFWGNVALKDGSSKIMIAATDMAGNTAQFIFDFEKSVNPINPIAVNDIIPVQEKIGRNFAVLIASQNYDDSSIPSLENPISDAVKLKLILKNSYNFTEENIITLFNPERSNFKKQFLMLSEIIQPEDNLIIFYAGHGIWVDKEKKGYWLLTDAMRNDVNTWLPNKEVLTMISVLPSRHTLLITDACFSGSVFKTRSIGADAPAAVKELGQKISRVAITSGNDTEVPDESVFMKYLVKALSDNKDKYLTAQKMFITQIIEAVMSETKTEPRYGTLEAAGHVGGDFIFTKK
ncbi:caspase family protein [Solitalea sp. MAHUQ-68]|uniref:Caspase family protein n=1 Tax=Solitalea agri TaxID=2953739 RepID=A0A9X2JC91_9SPHI|nr:caspase family protein [Solitalea agri]MCO4291520.1 caspase family protein [Solitalea agri]